MIARALARFKEYAPLALRLGLSAVFLYYGYHKVTDLAGFTAYMATLGIPGFLAVITAFTELIFGFLLLFGLFTRFAAVGLIVIMLVAIFTAELSKGLPGYALNLVIIAGSLSLALTGAGSLSVDRDLIKREFL